eukprot:gb/GEZN01011634.1/.p1 GENE.gb/GEZN01011634.1/~~gb/GEZN01011634.1/.p1  ORF type:complete len:233 (+),score=24.44 gb/GEZN01011634.1/:113-811(+)
MRRSAVSGGVWRRYRSRKLSFCLHLLPSSRTAIFAGMGAAAGFVSLASSDPFSLLSVLPQARCQLPQEEARPSLLSVLPWASCQPKQQEQANLEVEIEFRVGVKSRFMFAHTLAFLPTVAPFFTGGTYVIDAIVSGNRLATHDILINITLLDELLNEICQKYHHKNLDTLPEFQGRNSTVECMAEQIWQQLVQGLKSRAGEELVQLSKLEVRVAESDVAWASYKRDLPPSLR